MSWITAAWSAELQAKNPTIKNSLTNLLANFENSWLGITDLSVNKNEHPKFKDFKYMKEFMRNLTDFSLYLKKRPETNKVPIAEIFARKLNNLLIEKRQKEGGSGELPGLLLPFQLQSTSADSLVVGLAGGRDSDRGGDVFRNPPTGALPDSHGMREVE